MSGTGYTPPPLTPKGMLLTSGAFVAFGATPWSTLVTLPNCEPITGAAINANPLFVDLPPGTYQASIEVVFDLPVIMAVGTFAQLVASSPDFASFQTIDESWSVEGTGVAELARRSVNGMFDLDSGTPSWQYIINPLTVNPPAPFPAGFQVADSGVTVALVKVA